MRAKAKTKSPVFKALLTKRNTVEKTGKEKGHTRNSKAARQEKRQAIQGD